MPFAGTILEMGSEDYYGLYDAPVYLPDTPREQAITTARDVIRSLVREGLVDICIGTWRANDFTPVPADRLDAILDDPSSWEATGGIDSPVYVFANTPLGDSVYERGETQ
jgi:hypothetical protein